MEEAAFFFVAAAFLAVGLADDLVTLPDLVLPSTLGTSTTAGAYHMLVTLTRKKKEDKRETHGRSGLALLGGVGLGLGDLGGGSLLCGRGGGLLRLLLLLVGLVGLCSGLFGGGGLLGRWLSSWLSGLLQRS